jgi:hypothetical protein
MGLQAHQARRALIARPDTIRVLPTPTLDREQTVSRPLNQGHIKKPAWKNQAGFLYEKERRRPTLPRNRSRSTIGAEELNDRVRDGNGCDLLARTTAPRVRLGDRIGVLGTWFQSIALWGMVKPHGPLGSVSSTHCCAYTPDLSTSWSTRGLQPGSLQRGILILGWVSRLDAFSGYPFRT